ncbi:hypothetical protein, partial [Bacteroides acidifaciens]|uniref:hypothetical protein n=1 Tax=Bacteroides acidifaciens TaxID=85831 RepID=UPI00242C3A91
LLIYTLHGCTKFCNLQQDTFYLIIYLIIICGNKIIPNQYSIPKTFSTRNLNQEITSLFVCLNHSRTRPISS